MICPNCQLNVKKPTKSTEFQNLRIYFFQCPNCDHVFAGTRNKSMLNQVPPDTFIPEKFPESVRHLSPEAFRIYCNVLIAKANNLNEFAGVGLRVALENLLTDYLTIWKNIPDNEIPKTLKQKADKLYELNNSFYSNVCTKIVRSFGNDSAHPATKFPSLNLNNALFAFETLCAFIDTELHLAELNAKIEN